MTSKEKGYAELSLKPIPEEFVNNVCNASGRKQCDFLLVNEGGQKSRCAKSGLLTGVNVTGVNERYDSHEVEDKINDLRGRLKMAEDDGNYCKGPVRGFGQITPEGKTSSKKGKSKKK